MTVIYLILGGALGTLARYGVSLLSAGYYAGKFPLGTFTVNILGSLLIGFFWSFWNNGELSLTVKTFLFIGFFGGFTTFSSFALESLQLFRSGYNGVALMYIFLSNVVGIAAVFGGYFAAKLVR